ncbi:MAG: DNA-binding protein [Sphaerobacteraceae bacterium]|nr:MAG: DNA-binding protein [Sphaerobacteraceae bacterium]
MRYSTERTGYTVPEVAELLNVSNSTVWRWIRSGKLRAYRVGSRNMRVRPRDLLLSDGDRYRRNRSLSLEEAQLLAQSSPDENELARRRALFEKVMRTRKNRSIAPYTSDELVRRSRERDFWYAPNE